MQIILRNKAARNATWIIACKIGQAILGLLISMIVARYLKPEKYGLLNYAISLTTFITPLAQLGFASTIVYELVSHPEDEGKILGSAILSSVFSSIICIMGLSVFVKVSLPGEPVTQAVCVLYSILLVFQNIELIQYWFQSKLLARYPSVITFFAYAAVCVYQFTLVKSQADILWFSVSKSIEYILICIGLFVMYRRLGGKKLSFSFSYARQLFSKSRHYMLSSLLVMTFAQADRIMIKLMIGDTAMGYYSAAVVCANLSEFVFLALIDSLRPVILENKKDNPSLYESGVSALYGIVIYLSLIQSVFITILARPIISVLYGADYLPAANALRIIVWYTAFSYIGFVRNIWILAEEKQKYVWRINLCGAAVNIVLNAISIPIWGINGAALASLLTQAFTNVGIGFFLTPLYRNNTLLAKGLRINAITSFLRRIG